MKVIMIPIVEEPLGTLPGNPEKRLNELEIKVGIENIQTTALLKSSRILRIILETRRDLLSPRPQRKTIS